MRKWIIRALFSLTLIFSLLLTMIICLLQTNHLSQVLNYFLADQWRVEWNNKPKLNPQYLQLSDLKLYSLQGNCELISIGELNLNWWHKHLSTQQFVLDYTCMQQLPASESQTSTNSWLALLPEGQIHIADFHLRNGQELTSQPALQQLLQSNLSLQLQHQQNHVALQLLAFDSQPLLQVNAQLSGQKLQGEVQYFPNTVQQHQLQFDVQLNQLLTQPPLQTHINYRWHIPNFPIEKGKLQLLWQSEKGMLRITDENITDTDILSLPFEVQQNQIEIKQGRLYFPIPDSQPLNAIFDFTFTPQNPLADLRNKESLLPANANLRLTLLSQGDMGKGALVLNGQGNFNQQDFSLPLTIHGNVKYQDAVAYANLPVEFKGSYQQPHLRLLPSALLRVTGKNDLFHIDEIRLPLAGVSLDRYGLQGRLQAIFKGNTQQFSNINLHLDGQANEFIAGIHSIFDLREPTGEFAQKLANHWSWQFWGKAQAKALKTEMKVSGKGFWHNDHIEIHTLDGLLGTVIAAGTNIPQTTLNLNQPIIWQYKEQQLNGGLQIQSPYIRFNYGGEFKQPHFNLTFQGKNIDDLNFNGELIAQKLGPIKLFAHYFQQKLVGNIYWLEQPANVFQSLFSSKWNWLIQKGKIRGETAFSLSQSQGIKAGGYFAIKSGEISLPDGDIKGIQFALPYQYQNGTLALGTKQPVEVFIKQINKGIQLDNLKVKVQGAYPYSKNKPLKLSELIVDLFGGKMSIQHLSLPQQRVANISLTQIDLAKLLQLLQYNQVQMQGRINADFPFWLTGKHCLICEGRLTQTDKVTLSLTPALIEGFKQGGLTERILLDLFNPLTFQTLQANLNLSPTGEMQLQTQLTGYNPNKHLQRPITLNYRHRENLFDLWRNIDYGSQLEQHLEHSIYQQMSQQ